MERVSYPFPLIQFHFLQVVGNERDNYPAKVNPIGLCPALGSLSPTETKGLQAKRFFTAGLALPAGLTANSQSPVGIPCFVSTKLGGGVVLTAAE